MSEHFQKIDAYQAQIDAAEVSTKVALEAFRIQYLGSKNELKSLFGLIREVPNEEKSRFGQALNALKNTAQAKYDTLKIALENDGTAKTQHDIDLTAPTGGAALGSRHPISLMMNRVIDIFEKMGFSVEENREIEDDWHNFSAMNTPEDHPARDMQDTFYLENSKKYLLRTHTSSVQARMMTSTEPPIRMIAPGRVYRNETVSARSHCQFHQVEGLYIDKDVSFADLKQTLLHFAREMYGPDTKIRLRPSYFPFTEPSAEMDVYWGLKNETDYRITKGTGWLEILGCGMVDPKVLENCGIDSEVYSGYAFGMGIERQAMLKYDISDIRLLFENDLRFLGQFSSVV